MECKYYIIIRYINISHFNEEDDGKTFYEVHLAITDEPNDISDRDLMGEVYTVYDGKLNNQPDNDKWDDFARGEEWGEDYDAEDWDDCYNTEEEALKRAKEIALDLVEQS